MWFLNRRAEPLDAEERERHKQDDHKLAADAFAEPEHAELVLARLGITHAKI
jgi:hypothetical protein